MASFTLKNEAVFPIGTSVSAYPQANWPMSRRPPVGAPVGSPTETQVVGAGGAAFVALADATNYYAYAASPDRYVAFRTPAAATGGGGSGSVATDALWNAKGDLAVATGSGAASRLAVGANGLALVGDSTQATGLGWAPIVNDLRSAAGRPGVAETYSRLGQTLVSGGMAGSGVLRLAGFAVFRAGVAVTQLSCVAGSGTPAGITNAWMCVARASDSTVLAVSNDTPGNTFSANARQNFTIAGGWTPTQNEVCYVGLMVAATTMPNVYGVGVGHQNIAAIQGSSGYIVATHGTGLTTPIANGTVLAVTAPGSLVHHPWFFAS